MANSAKSNSIAPALPVDDYFTPEASALCRRVKHKSELTDDETLMLALAAAQAALARYFHPGARSAEDALNTIGAILDHEPGRRAPAQNGFRPRGAKWHFISG
jgi:hypothetical protein